MRPLGRQLLSAVMGTAILTGCAAVPDLGPMPAPKAQARSDAVVGGNRLEDGWPQDDWWKAYGDPQLDALMAEALAGSPTYRAAAVRVRRVDAVAEQAGSLRFPEIAADAQTSEAKQSYNNGIPALFVPKGYHDNGRATLGLSWDADPWRRNRDALAAATSEALATRADAAEARRILTASVAQAYADLMRAFEDRDAAAAAANIRSQTLELVRIRQASGLDTQTSLKQTIALERGAQADVLALDETILQARDRLAALLGAGPERGERISRPTILWQPASNLPAAIPLDLIGRRPDVAAARIRIEAAGDRVRQARKDFYPNLNLASLIGAQSLDLRDLTRAGSTIGSVGVATHLPIFEAGRLQGAYRISRADYDAAIATYDAAVAAAFQETADALASRKTVAERITRTQAALKASEDAYQSAHDRYDAQLSPYLTVLTAQDTLIANRRALADLRARALSLDVGLIRALGGGYAGVKTPPPSLSGS